jgi:protein SERAC1
MISISGLNICSVILVHGLQGDPFETWEGLKSSWPKDFLTKDVPTARILTFGYGNLLEPESATSIKGLGQLLLGSISLDRTQHGNATRPIIFVAHSFGGLIVKSVRRTRYIFAE